MSLFDKPTTQELLQSTQQALRPMPLAQLLIKHGLVDESAVYDFEGYDGGVTMEQIYRLSRELLGIPGPRVEEPPVELPLAVQVVKFGLILDMTELDRIAREQAERN